MNTFYIAMAALLGGIVTALLGWLECGDPFSLRKFGGSMFRSLIAAAIFAAGYQVSASIGVINLLYAFLGGAGVDVIGNRVSGKFGNGSFPLAKPPETPGEGGR